MTSRQPLSRSEQMARIKSTDTKPELMLRRALWAAGLRYRRRGKAPAGRPDAFFPGKRVAVFADGCFWHGCPAHYVPPRSRTAYWTEKLRTNVERDAANTQALTAAGWRVVRVLACAVHHDVSSIVPQVEKALRAAEWTAPRTRRVVGVESLDDEGQQERRHLIDLHDAGFRGCVERPRSFLAQGRRARGPSRTSK